jgi:glutamine amidotransferase
MLEAPVIEPAPPPPPAPIAAAPVEAADLEPLRRRVKVPHVGWNSVEPTGEHYYFVHSYFVEPARAEDVMWMATYGGIRFPAAVRHQNVLGCQFHPEKSQRSGLKFLRAFLLGGWG